MKKLLSVAIALLMVLAIVPMSVFAKAITPTVNPDYPLCELTMATDTVDAPAVGTRTNWMVCTLNEHSLMTGCAILVEFPKEYVDVQSAQFTGSWSLCNALMQVTDGSTDWIYNGSAVTNMTEGGNSTLPIVISDGEDGVWYTVFQLAVKNADGQPVHGGIELGGSLFRIRYQFTAVPEYNCTLPIVLHCPILGCINANTYYPEENKTITDGAIIVTGLGDAPVVTPEPTAAPTAVPTAEPTTPPATGDNPVTWTGDAVDQKNAAVGGTFDWYISITENSGLNSAELFIDYPEQYLNITAAVTSDFDDMDLLGSWMDYYYEEEGEYPEGSATPAYLNVKDYVCTAAIAEEMPEMTQGETYARFGLACQYFMTDYAGFQWGGKLIRYTYQWNNVDIDPADVLEDENGTYLPIKIYNRYTRPFQVEYPYYHNIDENVLTVIDGKVYVTMAEPVVTHTVTFVDGLTNEVIATVVVNDGEAATAPEVPVHEGYEFTGWDKAFDNVTEDITVTAQYEEIIVPPAQYQLTIQYLRYSDALEDWVALQNQYTATVTEGDEYDVANLIPEQIGDYVLDHVDGETSGTVAGNIAIVAYYVIPAPNTYTVTFVDGLTNEVIATQVVEEGNAATAPAVPEHEGYNFVGWDKEFNNITEDTTVTALYEEIPYEPVVPTVAGLTAELREREEGDTTADIRFIFKVTFNDSFINYEGTVYGPTQEYYEITKMWSVLNAGGKPLNVNGKNIWTMADDSFTYTATLINIPAARFGTTITATPYIIYSGVEATGAALEASVDSLLN